jgi:hypothetical protein
MVMIMIRVCVCVRERERISYKYRHVSWSRFVVPTVIPDVCKQKSFVG